MHTGSTEDLYRISKSLLKAHRRPLETLQASSRSHTREGSMPKVRFKEMVVEIQGTMYDVVFKKSPRGKTIVTKKPDTPALARRCKCVGGQVEQSPEEQPQAHAVCKRLCQSGDGRPAGASCV